MENARAVIRAGLIGSSIQRSRTPMMHVREGAAQGIDYTYEIFDLDCIPSGEAVLSSLLSRLERDGYAGVNVTHPCKQQVIELVSDLSPDARSIGAVNTVTFEGGRRLGRNTDWWGFAEAFKVGLPEVSLERVMLIGAGGAGAAASFALTQLGAKHVIVTDLEPKRADVLVNRLNANSAGTRFSVTDDFSRDLMECDGLVHTTPMGMDKYPGVALDPALLSPKHWVSDVVYVPLETELLRAAQAKGCRVLDGSGMAVFQAVRAFELFTGVRADRERMFRHFAAFEKPETAVQPGV